MPKDGTANMYNASFLEEVLVFLLAAVVVAPLFQRFKSSPVLGFLVAGAVIGPHGLGLVAETETTRHLAELGVVFLLFTIGLELSIDRLKVMRRQVFGLGTAQVVLTSLVIAGTALAAGLDARAAMVVGGGLALSSTAVVLQLLSERGELASRFGRASVAVLLLQDLAVVPMLTLVPALSGPGMSVAEAAGNALFKAAAVLGLILLIGWVVVRPLFRIVAASSSPELFAALTLLVLLGCAWLTGLAGLSIGLGGFLAGGVLDQDTGTMLFAVVAVTMALSPVLAAAGARLSRRLAARSAAEGQDIAGQVGGLRDHVVVAGYGRVGQAVARMLAEQGVPYVAFDLDPGRVGRARAEGLPVFYGDAARASVLRGAGVDYARAAVLTMDDPAASERAATALRNAFPDIRIFARARDEAHRRSLELAGATGIVSETFGLSQELGGAVLDGLDALEEPDEDDAKG